MPLFLAGQSFTTRNRHRALIPAAAAVTPAMPTITGMTFALEVFRETYNDGDTITSLTDRSGNGNTFTVPATKTGPTYKTSIIGGRAVARFTSANALSAALSQTQPNTIVWVGASAAGGGRVYDTNSSRHLLIITPSVPKTEMYAGTTLADTTASTSPDIIIARFNGASSNLYHGGGLATASGTANTQSATTIFYLGWDTGTAFFTGDTAAVYFIHSSASNADLNTLGSYLQTVFGITWTAM